MAHQLRTASIGRTFDDPRVADLKFKSTDTLLDRDVVLLNPSGLPNEYSTGLHSTYQGARSISEYDSPRMEADVARRKREIRALLERGGTLAVFLPPPEHWYIDTGERQYSGTGRNRHTTTVVAKRDIFGVFPFPISSEPARTRDLEVVGGEPFASFWRAVDGKMEAVAYLTVDLGHPTLKIRGSNATVAAIAKLGSGALIVLPRTILYDNDFDDQYEDDEDAPREPHPEDVE